MKILLKLFWIALIVIFFIVLLNIALFPEDIDREHIASDILYQLTLFTLFNIIPYYVYLCIFYYFIKRINVKNYAQLMVYYFGINLSIFLLFWGYEFFFGIANIYLLIKELLPFFIFSFITSFIVYKLLKRYSLTSTYNNA